MASLALTIFRNYLEDRRLSMEIYADGLAKALRTHFPGRCHLQEFIPTLPPGVRRGVWGMRLARYGVYPWQARGHGGQINHIIDPGYGHLLYLLDPSRTVVTVHDLIPLLAWRGEIPTHPRGRRPWLNLISFNALRKAGRLIADSENTRRDLARVLAIPDDRITVIHPGIAPKFRPYGQREKDLAAGSLGLRDHKAKRVLITGAQFYKNHGIALQACARLRTMYGGPLELLRLGPPTPEFKAAAQDCGLEDITSYIAGVSGDLLPGLYNCVDLLLFPSLYEGFGWPPLEAMACGTPVVASNAASLPEVIGEAGLMCPPYDYEGLAQAMYRLLTENEFRRAFRERGIVQASRFSWEKTARQVMAAYERVAAQDH